MSGRARLLVFAHPQCPCSRATVRELSAIMAQNRRSVDAYVLFLAPQSEGDLWVKGALWQEAAGIPGLHLVEDSGGREAQLFGASTSGQVLLYDSRGRLLFKGGITAARGHVGPNAGSEAILHLLLGSAGPRKTTPVFGCSLRNESGS